jgi:hypothetical protein
MPPPPNAKAFVPIDGVLGLFEHRIEGAERSAAHHGAAHNQEVGASGVPHESPTPSVGGGAAAAGQHTLTTGVPHESLSAVVGGAAAAAGQHTLTAGLVQNFAEDRGNYSIVVGEAIFEASALSAEPGAAVASANTFLTVSGADFIIEHESNQGGHGLNNVWASSELDYLALNIKGWSPESGPVVIELHQPGHQFQPCGHQSPHGNYADVLAMAEAHGADSLSATLTNALAVENQFSFVNAIALVAV